MEIYIKGFKIKIDLKDIWRIEKYNYYTANRDGKIYFARSIKINGKWTSICLHREIMKTPKNLVCDHRDGDTLNFNRKNLRNCTQAENARNVKTHKDSTSHFKGVCWDRINKRWIARIMINGKRIYLGSSNSAKNIYHAYCEGARKYHGQFARLA